jgi:hypothetical protein
MSMPVRVAMKDAKTGAMSVRMEMKNVHQGRVSDALFELPKGYKKEAMPVMGMSGRMGGRMGPGGPGMRGGRMGPGGQGMGSR